MSTPKVNSKGQQELNRVATEFDSFQQSVKDLSNASVKELSHSRSMEDVKKDESEPQTKLSQKEIANSKDIYLKPLKVVHSMERFNEKWREEYNFQKEYVQFIAENYELIGGSIEKWTKEFPGQPAEYWEFPSGKPVWGPRYLAESLRKCRYHVFSMDERVPTGSADAVASYTGKMVVDTVKQRLDARPISSSKSIFMGASGF